MQRRTGYGLAILCAVLILTAVTFGVILKNDKPKTDVDGGENQTQTELTIRKEIMAEKEDAPKDFGTQENVSSTKNEPIEKTSQPAPKDTAPPLHELLCTLTVRCDEVLLHLEQLPAGKKDIIPADGIILAEQMVSFREGDSVFDVLYRTLKEQKIHFEFVNTPMFDSVYIEGIGNLYEFDCGELSGWLYTVNGKKPTYGCSQYTIQPGDEIKVLYTCNYLES